MLGEFLRKRQSFAVVLCASFLASHAHAVTAVRTNRTPFLYDITTFTTTLSLPVTDQVETIKMDAEHIKTRLERAKDDESIEPLSILINDDDAAIAAMTERLALRDSENEFADYLKKAVKRAKPTKKGSPTKTIEFDEAGFNLVDKDAFADIYARTHHKLTLSTTELKKDAALRREFVKQMTPFFSKKERKALLGKIMKGETIDIDAEMLPDFARKMVGKYIVYRGPNCFHAALAFHSPQFTSSSLINVKKETGYHRAMINYDELWRAINQNFYEVDPDKVPLKYGDMLVFFDVPEEETGERDHPVNFRWIRHTATYLFGGYTFSKGSKSPNTPYTVRTLAEEWKTWKKFTSNLGIKVFRRSQRTAKGQPPVDLSDWIY